MNTGPTGTPSIHHRCINTIRALAMDAVQKANSGHPGAPMGLAPAAYVLWTQILKHNPANPDWMDRDRFVLSGGHASMLLYSVLYLTGYDVSLDDLKNFRQWGSKTPGHPEFGHTPGVETTTGPLGQGFANAVGLAMAEKHLAERFNQDGNEIVNHNTYVFCGDGDMMEGITSESASLAGHLGLGKLICIYDDNKITIEGNTEITFTEDVAKRFKAYNWHVLQVTDGNDTEAILNAIQEARDETHRPSLICLHTCIAYGSPNKQNTCDAHGAPLGDSEVCLTKECLGLDKDKTFEVDAAVLTECRKCVEKGTALESQWSEKLAAYTDANPDLGKQWQETVTGTLPQGWETALPIFDPSEKPIATRAASGKVLNALAEKIPTLMGGSADLAPSNNTYLKADTEFQKNNPGGRNIRYGVREHAMAGIMNGLILHKGIRPYGGTFLVFSDYLRPSLRVASLMKLPVIYVFTHDSIAVGEDGPTHQPVEHVAALRLIPNLTVIRPADANETAAAWKQALENTDGPTALILSRQNLPILGSQSASENLFHGAYIIADAPTPPQLLILATGSEVHLAIEAQKRLLEKDVSARVISMPSWELFDKAPAEYQKRILPTEISARIAVEAGVSLGWERFVGQAGKIIGINRFGASAPGQTVMEKFGFNIENIVRTALQTVGKS